MNIFKKAIKEAKELDALVESWKTPKFSKYTAQPPPNPNLGWQPTKVLDTKPPNTGSNVVKPNFNYFPPFTVHTNCTYETPCGWCSKWDKRCDRTIGSSKPGTFDLALYHDLLERIIYGPVQIKYIKVTTEFYSYLERRYLRRDIVSSLHDCNIPETEFMGVRMFVDDSIVYPYEVVYK